MLPLGLEPGLVSAASQMPYSVCVCGQKWDSCSCSPPSPETYMKKSNIQTPDDICVYEVLLGLLLPCECYKDMNSCWPPACVQGHKSTVHHNTLHHCMELLRPFEHHQQGQHAGEKLCHLQELLIGRSFALMLLPHSCNSLPAELLPRM